MALMTVLGLMSGTSMDGVDAAVVVTDGDAIVGYGPRLFRPYTPAEREVLRTAVREARPLTDRSERPGAVAAAERIVNEVHGETVERLLRENHYSAGRGMPTGSSSRQIIDLIGFHGQTVLHAPDRRLTVQVGDGHALAARVGIPVVFDFRAADVAAGGEGAPLVSIYHRALAQKARLAGTVVVVNIGGVANITRIAADGSLIAGDTGPGNALIDDLVRDRTGAPMDEGGALGARGRADQAALSRLLDNPWFAKPLPKSLDRDAFSSLPVAPLSTPDAVATLTAFTARTIADAIAMAGGAERVVVVGGGANNPTLIRRLAADTGVRPTSAAALGWSPDFIEAEAFAFLAARSVRGLPLTFPGTTGVDMPVTGGVLAEPSP
jgi:anhydro-N-acetylmuramic acid kinase